MKNISALEKVNGINNSPLYVIHLKSDASKNKKLAGLEKPSKDEVFLQQIRDIIEERMDESNLGIEHICKKMYLSYMQVFRKIKALTGASPTAFIRNIRLQKAKELLRNTELNISEIAYNLGFTDPNYFSRVFRKEFGIPPRAMRKE